MKIKSPTEDKIIVELSAEDMLELDITYADMDYSTSETRRVMWTLLDRAGKQLGRDIDPAKRMMIEAAPDTAGGCTVCFTIIEKGASLRGIIKPAEHLTFEFENADCLLASFKAIAGEKSMPCSLYILNKHYRLLLSGAETQKLRRILSEYSCVCEGIGCYESTREYWQPVAENIPLKSLSVKRT